MSPHSLRAVVKIHGTSEAAIIAMYVAPGPIHLLNAESEDRDGRVKVGRRLVALRDGRPPAAAKFQRRGEAGCYSGERWVSDSAFRHLACAIPRRP